MNAIALDDERPALEIIQAFCERIDLVTLLHTFTRTGEARRFLEQQPVDLIFLDINMPSESGLSVARSVPASTQVIFTTAYSEFAVASYEVEAADYLLKPFTFDRFARAVQRAHSRWQAQPAADTASLPEPETLYVRIDYGLVPLKPADILFIEGQDNYLKIHRATGKPLLVRLTLKALLDKLPPAGFVRIHRSFIVAIDRIESIRNRTVLVGNTELPVGSSYEKLVSDRFLR